MENLEILRFYNRSNNSSQTVKIIQTFIEFRAKFPSVKKIEIADRCLSFTPENNELLLLELKKFGLKKDDDTKVIFYSKGFEIVSDEKENSK